MSAADMLVVLGGLGAVLWVNWYFFLANRGSAQAAVGSGGVQEVTVVVRGGYEPSQIRVKKGAPVRLVFDRQETSPCSEELALPDFSVRKFLPAHRKTVVELTPERAGSFDFTCGMSMLRGRLTVEE